MGGSLVIAAAWEEKTRGTDRTWFRLAVDLGILPSIQARIVENTKREEMKENAPTHLFLFSPMDGRDVRVGALWPYTNGEGVTYLTGHIDLAAFGEVALKGGGRVDFRLTGERIGVRLSAVEEPKSERSPTHRLWRMLRVSAEEESDYVDVLQQDAVGFDFGDGAGSEADDDEPPRPRERLE